MNSIPYSTPAAAEVAHIIAQRTARPFTREDRRRGSAPSTSEDDAAVEDYENEEALRADDHRDDPEDGPCLPFDID